METKNYIQFGTTSMVILIPMFAVCATLLVKSVNTESTNFFIYLFVSIILFVCILNFYQLKITISSSHIAFKPGIGLISKKYKLSDISSFQPVKNSILNGIGIRKLPNGWLYNVSGLDAIELQFKNKTSVVRIGTNKPHEISDQLQLLIKK